MLKPKTNPGASGSTSERAPESGLGPIIKYTAPRPDVDVNKLNKDDAKTAAVLKEVLGKRMVSMLFSEQPKLKSKAFNDLNRGIGKFDFAGIEKEER